MGATPLMQPLPPTLMGFLAIVVVALIGMLVPVARGDVPDPRIAANPLLQQIARTAPDALPGFLAELDRLSRPGRSDRSPRAIAIGQGKLNAATMRAPPTAAELAAIHANPAIDADDKVNPDPTIELLRRMIAAAAPHRGQ